MTEPQHVTDPLAIQIVNYLDRKGQIDATRWIAPKKSGVTAATEAIRNVQARADQKRREAAEAEVAKVLEQKGTAATLAYYLAGGSDTEPSEPVPLNAPQIAAELQRILDGD